jgi:transcriptional regulator with XRE-family HTH domain
LGTNETFGQLLRAGREASTDPLTGEPYTQMRLAEVLGMSDALISRWEHDKGTPTREIVNQLPVLLPTLGMADLLRSLGYQLPETAGLQPDEREVLGLYRALSDPSQRVTARRLLRALAPDPVAGRPQSRSRPRPRPEAQ